jgi:hypothetical protein
MPTFHRLEHPRPSTRADCPELPVVACLLFLFHMSSASINLLGNNLFSDSG